MKKAYVCPDCKKIVPESGVVLIYGQGNDNGIIELIRCNPCYNKYGKHFKDMGGF